MSLAVASFLGGAKSRLLPASIPFRFFAAAVAAHVLLWIALFAGSAEVPRFVGGLGTPLAAVHLLTLGMLAMTAIGAAFQLLPVATKQPMASQGAMRLTSWLFIPGVALLVVAMATRAIYLLAAGALLATLGLLLFAGLVAHNLWRVKGMGLVVAHGRAALAALVLVAAIGFVLAADYHHFWGIDHARTALAHFILGAFGFMGMLALGFSYVLVPMFALSPAPSAPLGYGALAAASAGILLSVAGAFAASPMLLLSGALAGLLATLLHFEALRRSLTRRMRKRLGLSFILVRGAWVLLPASLALGAALAAGAPVPNGATLFGFLALFGWLLTFVLGILQRIMPFLGSMHATRPGGKPPLVSELTLERPLQAHAVAHGLALTAVGAGIVLDTPALVAVGSLLGVAGALAFAWFALGVVRRMGGLGAIAS
ncbi:MAG: hypothetical protein IRZ04_11380 [Rhodospirillales bacterium]|nr:hypothetical protein [Rhodospirillales bacterium]